jgi:DNA ligase-1
LAQSWDNHQDLTDWWISEKLDGVRALWDGQQFLSRQGNRFHAPAWFVAGFPEVPLDGELWLARKSFQRTVSTVRRQDQSEGWREIKFVVFDAPQVAAPFETRMAFVSTTFQEQKPAYADVLKQERCKGQTHLREELARIVSLGGEGLMLRQPESLYEPGRSSTLLKVKTFQDAEAVVVDHVAGRGRHKGRIGALIVQLPDGTQFSVGTGFTDAQRNKPPPIGATITFRYQELTDGGVPRFPSFVGVLTAADAAGKG